MSEKTKYLQFELDENEFIRFNVFKTVNKCKDRNEAFKLLMAKAGA